MRMSWVGRLKMRDMNLRHQFARVEISTLASRCRIFMSRKSMSRIFSVSHVVPGVCHDCHRSTVQLNVD